MPVPAALLMAMLAGGLPVHDGAALLAADAERDLRTRLTAHAETTGVLLVVHTARSAPDGDVEALRRGIVTALPCAVGVVEGPPCDPPRDTRALPDHAALLTMVADQALVKLELGEALQPALPFPAPNRLVEAMHPALESRDYAGAVEGVVAAVVGATAHYRGGRPTTPRMPWRALVAAAALAGLWAAVRRHRKRREGRNP